ncbi:hypothetical protein [uncultured Roseovarius sp.]|uniref:hypothetical protein n=1 Tax=uncultured Roseovarius sp. TaxID=293344 RepID=UPI002613E21E|nr:hypothetical protein [uncultured Roseovarius sp.]
MTQAGPSHTPRTLRDVVNTRYTRIRYAAGSDDHLIISFSSIGRRRAEMPPDEFTGTLLRQPEQHCMFISDLRRSWMNDPHYLKSVKSAVDKIRKRENINRITTLGLSMGAFSALVASALFPVTTAIAISPQFTMSGAVMPKETRWRYWRKGIKTFRFETAEASPGPGRSYIFHGLENDLDQMRAFSVLPNRDHFVFPESNHSELGRLFKENGVLLDLVNACATRNRKEVARLVGSCGGTWRARYEKQQKLENAA